MGMTIEQSDTTRPRPEFHLMSVVMANLRALVIAFLAFGGAGYVVALFMQPAYRADALVMPRESSASGLLGGLVGAAGLGSMGFLSSQGVDKNVPLETIMSHALLERFVRENSVIPVLCAARAISCDEARGNTALNQERTMNSAIRLFQKHALSVNENQLTGVVTVSVIWYDRKIAAEWCNELIDLTNRVIQERAEKAASLRVQYLQQKYAATPVIPLQSAISTILQNEMTKQTDAATRSEFAWRVLDRAYPPDDRRPARPLKAVIAAVSGLLGSLVVLAVVSWRSRRG